MPLQVLITVDTETHPIHKDWQRDGLVRDMRRDLYGEVGGRSVGLHYQLRTLATHGLRANFMVESLFSATAEVGLDPLREIVAAIQKGGHEIGLHPHPEWIPHIPEIDLPYRSHLIREYTIDEQEQLIRLAAAQLRHAGAAPPIAFRAGGFAGNHDTLRALERCGVLYDTSYNPCYEDAHRFLPQPRFHGHATRFGAVAELPVAIFRDRPAHFRPAQLCACTFTELSHALQTAERQGWNFFVIVSHSFEMISRPRQGNRAPAVRQAVVDRFERLCAFLNTHRDAFPTVVFSELALAEPERASAPIQGRVIHTGGRYLSQALARAHTSYLSRLRPPK